MLQLLVRLIIAMCFLGSANCYANIIWPEIFIVEHLWKTSWLIVLSLMIEWPFVKYIIKTSWFKSSIPLVCANIVTLTIGALVVVVLGLPMTVIIDSIVNLFVAHHGTFDLAGWIGAGLFFAFCNTVFELGTIFLLPKITIFSEFLGYRRGDVIFSKKNFVIILVANFLSVLVTLLHMKYSATSY